MNSTPSQLNKLLVYRSLLANEIINGLNLLAVTKEPQQTEAAYSLAAKLIAWAEETGMNGNLAQNYFIWQIAREETVFSAAVEKYQGAIKAGLFQAAIHDLTILKKFIVNDLPAIMPEIVTVNYTSSQTVTDAVFAKIKELFFEPLSIEELVKNLIEHYQKYGSGEMAVYGAFRWEKATGLVKVAHVDPVTFDDIIGYDSQKKELIDNTAAFLEGRLANNVLLSGARGTGKSSSIKALLNRFFSAGLRLVEVKKEDFRELPQIMNTLRAIKKKFIILLDDLSFEEFETDYKYLKSLIDGGMEMMPENVLLYATSNRRHLVKETWHDRAGGELHSQDTVNEKISLSDRFGITIYYPSPTQDEYFKIVQELAAKNNISLSEADLKQEALKWEMLHSGRSGRVAKQFISYFAGQKKSAPRS
ncbi:MAG: ATP-binding protein [Sporomusaceae bacterium]|nr:ATP-binding protein [Sporomusaceae bacterium]